MELTQIGALAMNRRHFFIYRSRDVRLNGYCWMPEKPNQAEAVIQIAHGMAEHILRNEQFAEYLTTQGFIVDGHDDRRDDVLVMTADDWGCFVDANVCEKVVEDTHMISEISQSQYPELPLFLLGHTKGFYLARRYNQFYNYISGVILSGT